MHTIPYYLKAGKQTWTSNLFWIHMLVQHILFHIYQMGKGECQICFAMHVKSREGMNQISVNRFAKQETNSSRCITFINTSPPEERVVLLKPRHVLEDLKDDSTDIESDNILTLYQQRPKTIQGLCLADFVSQFSVKYCKE